MRYLRPLALTLVIGLLAACAPQGTFEVGMVTDLGPINDRSFNETTWNGLVRAQEELPVAADYRTSIDETDHAPNIEAFLEQETDMIVTVGFLLGDTTLAYARENPDVQFAIVDFAYDVAIPENLLSITFQTDEAAFLAGYLAAGMTQTGTVGTFGGLNIPTVTIFMDGFTAGVTYYNETHNTDVDVIGEDIFAGSFTSREAGQTIGADLIAQGADIIMPVAGETGLGAAEAAGNNPGTLIIGVDSDWCETSPEVCPVVLTSVMKRLDVAVYDAVEDAQDGGFDTQTYVGDLTNGGVDLAPFYTYEDDIPAELLSELEQLRLSISVEAIAIEDYLER